MKPPHRYISFLSLIGCSACSAHHAPRHPAWSPLMSFFFPSRCVSPWAAMKQSASAPALRNSPYTQQVGTRSLKMLKAPPKNGRGPGGIWVPPPGAFNEPDLPRFEGPGPGQYNPKYQHTCLSTKPRITGCRFGSEDRFKYLGPQTSLERTSSGLSAGTSGGQNAKSPGPGYNPTYDLVHSASRASSFTVQRRDTSGVTAPGNAPGPGLYNPSDRSLSGRRNFTAGGGFFADDRHKYLGELDPHSRTPLISQSPGPLYKPEYASSSRIKSVPGVAFGGHGPGTIIEPPSLKIETPGPGAYTPASQGGPLSTKPTVRATGFSVEKRTTRSLLDSSMCYHGKVRTGVVGSGPTLWVRCSRRVCRPLVPPWTRKPSVSPHAPTLSHLPAWRSADASGHDPRQGPEHFAWPSVPHAAGPCAPRRGSTRDWNVKALRPRANHRPVVQDGRHELTSLCLLRVCSPCPPASKDGPPRLPSPDHECACALCARHALSLHRRCTGRVSG